MARFFLLRHGDRRHEDVMVARAPDIHLTKNGHVQARRLAAHFRRLRVDAIYSSPRERALETVAPLARSKKIRTEIDGAFDEIDMGDWTGKSKATVLKTEAWKRFVRCSAGTSIPGGETLVQAQARIASALIRLVENHPRETNVVIGTHEDLVRLAVCYFIGAPIEVYEHITIRSGSITLLTLDHQGAGLQLLDVLPSGDPRLVLR